MAVSFSLLSCLPRLLPRTDRYIARELVVPFLINITPVVFLLLLLKLSGSIGELTQTRNPGLVVRAILLDLPDTIAKALPLVAALSTSLAMNRMTRDNEITVFKSTGVSVRRLFLSLIIFGSLVSLLGVFLVDTVVPWAWQQRTTLGYRMASTNFTQQNKAQKLADGAGSTTVFVQATSEVTPARYRVEHVLMIEDAESGGKRLVAAPTGEYAAGTWNLREVQITEFDIAGNFVRAWSEPTRQKRLSLDFRTLYNALGEDDLVRQPFWVLTERSYNSREMGRFAEVRDFDISRWFNIALPWMALPLSLLGAGLAVLFSKAGAFTGVLFSVGAAFVGWNTFLLLKGVANGGYLPPVAAAWTTHVLFLTGALWILRKTE